MHRTGRTEKTAFRDRAGGMWSLFITLWLAVIFSGPPAAAAEQRLLPDTIQSELEYIFSAIESAGEIDPGKLSEFVDFIRSAPPGISYTLPERNGSEGAFHAFAVNSRLPDVMRYFLNPDIPQYMTMPSSLQHHQWLTPEIPRELRSLINGGAADGTVVALRGQEVETITPDIHTGGYYTYEQDRFFWYLPDPAGPVLISATIQDDRSEIGRKGCVVGDDRNWDYLYSEQTGLTKTGLGWADTFMYKASAISVYAGDNASNTINVGSFKWLNAGWSKINMVKAHHILNGIKRFAHDFKNIIESPNLPEIDAITDRYQALQVMDDQELRLLVAPYLRRLEHSQKIGECSESFVSLVSSGEYLEQMGNQELIRILLLEYLKERLDAGVYEHAGFLDPPIPSVSVDS